MVTIGGGVVDLGGTVLAGTAVEEIAVLGALGVVVAAGDVVAGISVAVGAEGDNVVVVFAAGTSTSCAVLLPSQAARANANTSGISLIDLIRTVDGNGGRASSEGRSSVLRLVRLAVDAWGVHRQRW